MNTYKDFWLIFDHKNLKIQVSYKGKNTELLPQAQKGAVDSLFVKKNVTIQVATKCWQKSKILNCLLLNCSI